MLVIGSETLQILFPRYFTFDLWDIIASLSAFTLSSLLLQNKKHEKKIS